MTAIRPPAAAGRFYPATASQVISFIEANMHPPAGRQPLPMRALIVPHAGYAYSGTLAAAAFAMVEPGSFARAWICGPSHYAGFRGLALPPYEAFRTPLGDLPVDRDLVAALEQEDLFAVREDAHRQEHALEVLMPFIQQLAPEVPVLPMTAGTCSRADLDRLGQTIAARLGPRDLFVVSSDFTHYGGHFGYMPFPVSAAPEAIEKLDRGAIDRIAAGDLDGFLRYVDDTGATICGRYPIAVLLATLAAGGIAANFELLDYQTSGEMTGDYSTSVSYAAMLLPREDA